MPRPRMTVPAEDLRRLTRQLFGAAGMSDEDAAQMADTFVWANLRGIDSHGVSRVPRYLELFEKGDSNPRPKMRTQRVRPAALQIEADRAPGPVALTRAMIAAVDLARETGVAIANVRATALAGAIGYYTNLAAREGMAGIGLVAGIPNMGYEGARGAAVATSPLSIAVPTSEGPAFLLDMATAAIALGKIAQYRNAGEPLPPGAAVSAEGEPTTDAAEAKIPLPVGGAKGSGMSLAFELLTSGLAGNPIVAEYHSGDPAGRRHRQNATLIAIDVTAFLARAQYEEIVERTLRTIKSLPPMGDRPVLFPGERGAATLAEREREGIPIPVKVWDELAGVAEARGIEFPTAEKVG